MYKIAKHTVPIPISRLFKLSSDVHNYNTRQAHHIHSFKGNNEFIYRTFKFLSVFIWNSILQNININVSFPTFKHVLKRFLLNNNTSVRYDKYDLIPILINTLFNPYYILLTHDLNLYSILKILTKSTSP